MEFQCRSDISASLAGALKPAINSANSRQPKSDHFPFVVSLTHKLSPATAVWGLAGVRAVSQRDHCSTFCTNLLSCIS